MRVNTLKQIIIIFLTSNNIVKFVYLETVLHPATSDFSKIVKSKFFFDKSMLIKEILTYKFMHITCPRQFGKSTNMDMVKKFLEINVNELGEPIMEIQKTENYKLFKDNNLNIFQKTHFFKTHFGKYPIMFIDYSDFREITNFTSVLSIYKTIIQHTFNKYKYLLGNPKVWSSNATIEKFNKYRNGEMILSFEDDIRKAFVFLLHILFDYYKKQTYILIDNYDSHVDSLLFKYVPNLDRILTFIHSVNEHLLNDNTNLIYGGLLTGVLRLSSVLPTLLRTDVLHFKFYLDHVFADFYGVTEDELDNTLIKLLPDITERNQTRETIDQFYKAYKIATQHTRMYNIWSIVNFLESRKVKSYWCRPGSFKIFNSVLNEELVKDKMESLLSGQKVWASVPNPFFNEEIINLNKMIMKREVEIDSDLVDLLFVVMYHFGFLSPSTDISYYSIALKVPNREIFNEIKRTVQDVQENNTG